MRESLAVQLNYHLSEVISAQNTPRLERSIAHEMTMAPWACRGLHHERDAPHVKMEGNLTYCVLLVPDLILGLLLSNSPVPLAAILTWGTNLPP